MSLDLIDQFKAARRCSVPVIGISSSDQMATVRGIAATMKGGAPVFCWDVLRGFSAVNDQARDAMGDLGEAEAAIGSCTAGIGIFAAAAEIKRGALFILNAHRYLDEITTVQAVSNVRDKFKGDGRTLILLAPAMRLPTEISGDTVLFDEPLPTAAALEKIVRQAHSDKKQAVTGELVAHAVDAVLGLPAFQAEQSVAMSLVDSDPIDVEGLWESKRRQIEQTPGLKVWRGGDRFESIGGCNRIKEFAGKVLQGNGRPAAIVFIDEIEKMFAGAGGDLSGVSQDQLGTILQYMQDESAAGMIFIGPPGSGKSAIAKAAGAEGNIPTIQLDLGASKGGIIGQSESQIRGALKVITAVSNKKSLWVATCNQISSLPPELRRRFTLGTYFFDLPSREERDAIWKIHKAKFGLKAASHKEVQDTDWTGAEIRQCCEIAWRLGGSLTAAASYVVPVAKQAADQIERLRTQADGKFLSAAYEGVYRRVSIGTLASEGGRQFHGKD
jgi:hypothetical protein